MTASTIKIELRLQTQRLIVDALRDEDADFILELVNSKGWLRFIGNRNVTTQVEALSYIRSIRSNPDLTYWVVRLKEEGNPAGIVSLVKRDYLEHPDIGFAFLPEYMQQGYATEAVRAVVDHLQKMGMISRLLAVALPGNASSISLLGKIGMQFERRMDLQEEKLAVYALNLRDE